MGQEIQITRRRLLRGAGALGVLGLAPGALAACGSGDAEGGGGSLRELSFALPYVPDLWDVTKMEVGFKTAIALQLETLLDIDPASGQPRPNVAESFESVNPTTYRVVLREGVRFSNGDPLTMEDVLFSMELHRDPDNESSVAFYWNLAERIAQTGEREITVRLRQPDITFPAGLAFTGVVQRSWWTAEGRRPGTPDDLALGTGPFVLRSLSPGERADLVRNDRYWGERPEIERLTLRFIQDENTALATVRTRQLTGQFGVAGPSLRQYKALPGVRVYESIDPEMTLIFMNPRLEPFDDPRVRLAVAQAIDRQRLVQTVYPGGAAIPSQTLVGRNLLATVYDEPALDELERRVAIPFDLEAARRTLASSSRPQGFEIRLITPDGEPDLRRVAQALGSMLEPLGIRTTVRELPSSQYDERIFFGEGRKTEPIGLVGYSAFAFNPYDQLVNMLAPKSVPPEGYANVADYVSPESRRLFRELHRTDSDDRAAQAEAITPILELNRREVVYVPLLQVKDGLALDERYRYRDFTSAWFASGQWYRRLQSA